MMGKKIIVITLAVFAFGFAFTLRSNAGTEIIEPYSAPAPRYNYAPPPPRPVVFIPPPVVGVVVRPAFGPAVGHLPPQPGVPRPVAVDEDSLLLDEVAQLGRPALPDRPVQGAERPARPECVVPRAPRAASALRARPEPVARPGRSVLLRLNLNKV